MRGRLLTRVSLWAAGVVIVIYGFFPVVWILFTSLKTEAELTRLPITYWPKEPTIANYRRAFQEAPLVRYFVNSLIVAAGATVLCVTVSTLAAYSLARLRIRFAVPLLLSLVAIAMFPPTTLIVPLYQIFTAIGLRNTYLGLILPHATLSVPVALLVLYAFFKTIPKDLESAALVDGCTRIGALRYVVLPLAGPGVFTAALLTFVNSWDEFLLALTLAPAKHMRTLPVGITLYQGEYLFPWPLISAALIVAMIPVAVVIAVFQERIISGLTQGALKG